MTAFASSSQGGLCWLASYPKSGNTWFRIVLRACLSEDPVDAIDLDAIQTGAIASSRVWIDDILGFDTSDLTQDEVMRLRPSVYRWTAAQGASGYHKIHDAYSLTPDGVPLIGDRTTRAVIYLLRNPLDVAPSLAYHLGTDMDTAIARMGDRNFALSRARHGLSGQLLQRLGTWSDHVSSWVDACGVPVHVVRYEDMLSDPQSAFAAAFSHLGLTISPERLAQAIEAGRFERLATLEAERGFRERSKKAERFFRRGQAGGWRDTLSPEQVQQIIADHRAVMARFGYLDARGAPL